MSLVSSDGAFFFLFQLRIRNNLIAFWKSFWELREADPKYQVTKVTIFVNFLPFSQTPRKPMKVSIT